MREREWRVVTLDDDGRVLSNYGERLSEEMARTVHRFARSRDGEAATLQFREPPEPSPPWETVSVPAPASPEMILAHQNRGRRVARHGY